MYIKKILCAIKDDITLASNRPNVENLLWYMAEPRNLDLRPGENKLRVKGELAVFLLYTGYEEENHLSGWSIPCLFPMRWNAVAVWKI